MTIISNVRRAKIHEIAAEMDRRGTVIETVEAERDRFRDALENIDAVGVDFGHFEAAARTMQEICREVLYPKQRVRPAPVKDDGPTAA